VNENELYELWRKASEEERPALETQLYEAVKRHAQAVAWKKLGEIPRNLCDEIAGDVVRQLDAFRGDSKFSTWVQAIAQNHISGELRRRVRDRS
jgi:DNA-directed RNA polymerase specialized sigma24 family protein